MDVVGAHIGQGPAPLVLELDLRHMVGTRCASRVMAPERLQLRLLVGGDHVVVRTQRPTIPQAGVEIQDRAALAAKSGSRGKIQDR